MEEFEMKVTVGDPFNVFTYTNEVKGSHSIEVDYFATFSAPLENIKIHPDDHSTFGWFSEEEIKVVFANRINSNDPEIKAIYKAFSLLKGNKLDLG
jgi:hypothetical protein